MKSATILLVDDNADMRRTLRAALERDGYTVVTAPNGHDMIESVKRDKPDAILLDLVLPDGNGLNFMASIRACTGAPVIVVSGKGDLVDKVIGLEMGADDYVSKPFQMKELSARLKAQLRRARGDQDLKTAPIAETIIFGGWIFDRHRMQVFDADGKSAGLTVREFRLLEIFLEAPQQVLTRDQLLDRSRQDGGNITDRAIDTQIVRIRKKLNDTAEAGLITSVRGAGYMFTAKIIS